MKTHSTKQTDMTTVQNPSSHDTCMTDDIGGENVVKDEFRESTASVLPMFSLLTGMLISNSVSSAEACADPPEGSNSCVPTPSCSSGETTVKSQPTRLCGTFTSVADKSKTSVSNASATLLGMLTNNQSEIGTVSRNSIVDYIGIFPTSTECPSDMKIFQQWEENQSRCDVCGEHCLDGTVYKEHFLLHRSLSTKAFFKCYQCHRLLSKNNIRDHVKMHARRTAYSCHKCAKDFLSKSSFKIHMAVHEHEQEIKKHIHVCHECDSYFMFESDLAKHASEHQRQLLKHIGSKKNDDVDDSDGVMEEHARPEKVKKSMRPWRDAKRSLPDPEMNETDPTSSVEDMVIKQEVETEESEDMDTIADTSGGRRDIINTSDAFPEGFEEQDARASEDVPFSDLVIKQERGGVPTDGAELCVTLPQPAMGDTSEDGSRSFNSLCCGHPESFNSMQDGDDGIGDREASEIEHVLVPGDSGEEHWIVQKADSGDEDGETDEISVKSEPSQDVLSSQVSGPVSPTQKSSSVLLSILTRLEPNQQEGSQVVFVKTVRNDEKRLPNPNRSTVKDLLLKKLQNPQKNYIVKSHKKESERNETTTKVILIRSRKGGKWSSKMKVCPNNEQLNNEWTANHCKCPVCEEVCESVSVFKEHYLFHQSLANNDGQYVQCCECNATVLNTYLRKHVKVHSGPFTCDVCDETYAFKSKYDIHLKMHKEEGHRYQCNICKKDFGDAYFLKRHTAVHKMYQCSVCSHLCVDKHALVAHRRTHKTLYVCTICDKVYCKAAALSSHMRFAHSFRETIPNLMRTGFTCDKCFSTFSTEMFLKQHQKLCNAAATQTPTQDRTDQHTLCNVCRATFINADALNVHIKCAHPKLAHMCRICGKMYSKGKDLLSHTCNGQLLSSDDNVDDKVQYACSDCNKLFQTKDLLQDHCSHKCQSNTTTGKRRKCNEETVRKFRKCNEETVRIRRKCNEKETEKLIMRKKTHKKKNKGNTKRQAAIPKFQCVICLKVFKSKKGFQMHSQSAHEQTDTTPLRCMKCHAIFVDETHLSIHIRMAHNSENIILGVEHDQ